MTPEEARSILNQMALKDLSKTVGVALAGGVALRGAVGLAHLLQNSVAGKKKVDDNFVVIPHKAAADRLDYPLWFSAGTLLGAPLAAGAGWAGVGAAIKQWRKIKLKGELEAAKKEFEEALSMERQSKFAASLHKLADTYVRGEIKSATSLWDTLVQTFRASPHTASVVASLAGLTGGVIGWNSLGKSKDEEEVAAYRDLIRRRNLARSPTVQLRLATTPDIASG